MGLQATAGALLAPVVVFCNSGGIAVVLLLAPVALQVRVVELPATVVVLPEKWW